MQLDPYYTPEALARRLIAHVPKSGRSAIDLCIGDGALLRELARRRPHLACSGVDVSKETVRRLRRANPQWQLRCYDVTGERGVGNTRKANKRSQHYDVVLINPPFSCIGGTRHVVEYEGVRFTCSRAMSFLIAALSYLSASGTLYAILPNSVAYAEKDAALWSTLCSSKGVTILDETVDRHFEKAAARVLLVQVTNTPPDRKLNGTLKPIVAGVEVKNVLRGNLAVHRAKFMSKGALPYVHSTNLQNGTISGPMRKVSHAASRVSGPAVLLPRVGVPARGKLCILEEGRTVVLSDCVIAVGVSHMRDAHVLRSSLLKGINTLAHAYKGTGARYITLKRLGKLLGTSEHHQRSNVPVERIQQPVQHLVSVV